MTSSASIFSNALFAFAAITLTSVSLPARADDEVLAVSDGLPTPPPRETPPTGSLNITEINDYLGGIDDRGDELQDERRLIPSDDYDRKKRIDDAIASVTSFRQREELRLTRRHDPVLERNGRMAAYAGLGIMGAGAATVAVALSPLLLTDCQCVTWPGDWALPTIGTGLGLMGAGGVISLVGLGVMNMGSHKVPREHDGPREQVRPSFDPTPSVSIGPTSMGLAWKF